VLVELSVVEQRFRAVREVLDGMPLTEVARPFGVQGRGAVRLRDGESTV